VIDRVTEMSTGPSEPEEESEDDSEEI